MVTGVAPTAKGAPLNGVCAGGGGEPALAILSQLKLPTEPLLPTPSSATRRMCWPFASVTPLLVTVCQVWNPPVLGTASEPVMLAPSISAWNLPPAADEATRNPKS